MCQLQLSFMHVYVFKRTPNFLTPVDTDCKEGCAYTSVCFVYLIIDVEETRYFGPFLYD